MSTPPDEILDTLTAYALDALEPEEMARVGELLAKNPDLRKLYAELRITVDRLPYGLPDAAPPPELRQAVLDRAVGRTPARATTPASRKPRDLRGWLASLGALAAVCLVAAVAAFGQLGAAQSQLEQVRGELERQVALNDTVAKVVAKQPATLALSGKNASGAVLRSSDGQLVLAANLPPLGAGRVYQFWLIEANNAPTSGGVFTVDANGSGLLTLQAPADSSQLFAVTEEPGPSGSPGPTTPILISNIPAS